MTKQDQFLDRWETSFKEGSFVRASFTGARNLASPPPAENAQVRLIELNGLPAWSVTFREQRGDRTRNFPPGEFFAFVRNELLPAYRTGLLGTTRKDWQLIQSDSPGKEARLVSHASARAEPPSRTHDQKKPSLLDERARDWLLGLDVTTEDGKVRGSMADKHRQIHRYLEILSHHLEPCESGSPFSVVDMGCGKGYLTFAVWHWIHRIRGASATVVGIDSRKDLVDRGNELALSIQATGLVFRTGAIQDAEIGRPDALIALHACDTATDDAILKGVSAGVKHLMVAPCCHQDLRPQLGRPIPWDAILEHGILLERFAEWLSDGLRSLYLQAAGYSVKVLEFVGAEHTPKNLLICASRPPREDHAARQRAIERIRTIQAEFGVAEHPLGKLARDAEEILMKRE
ncbi:MAG: SAM-dependent methyltransferase [Verrucomicrobia bacterium]|nr:SAM-dependent methyltransferase [Verrucomicrobiota bacterium]MBI3867037.1 SAM-dependent methyltransferase [Verrucomicrobiota bacterium]